jgi:hypothetical protein
MQIAVQNALRAAFDYARLKAMLSSRLDRKLEEISLGDNLEVVVAVLVARAHGGGWMSELIEAAHAERPDDQNIQKIYNDYLAQRGAPGSNPWDVHVLPGRRLMVDRTLLRQAGGRLERPGGTCALVLVGPKDSGKSHSEYLFHHVANATGKFRIHSFSLGEQPDIAPDDLAYDIVSRVGGDASRLPPPSRSGNARRAMHLADWIGKEIAALNVPRWLFFDSCGHPRVQEATRDLIVQLIARADGEQRQWLRVIAVELPGPLPPRMRPTVDEEQISPLTEDDVCQLVKKLATAAGKSVTDATLVQTVAAIWAKYPANTEDRMELLTAEVRRLLINLGLVDAP